MVESWHNESIHNSFEPVYCKQCKHLISKHNRRECHYPENMTVDEDNRWFDENLMPNKTPTKLNADNDCGWYEVKD